jgi:hypothetical protein
MRPIETRYKGYRFRSRLEARWAVFFDALGLTYEYEPEGFVLSNGVWYLPDFRVTSPRGQVTWYEVKPITVASDPKFEQLKLDLPENVAAFLLRGDPADLFPVAPKGLYSTSFMLCHLCGAIQCDNVHGVDSLMRWHCAACDQNTPCGRDHVGPTLFGHTVLKSAGMFYESAEAWCAVEHEIAQAVYAARGARFEHNESGT